MTLRKHWRAGLALALALALPGCSQPAAASPKRPIAVRVQAAQTGPSTSSARYSGSLEPASQVALSFRVSGYVEALGQTGSKGQARPLDKGDLVKKGTILARLRAADYEHKVATGKAAVLDAAAKARLASSDLERSRRLFAASVLTQAELDTQLARAESARAAVADAKARTSDAELALSDTLLRAPIDGVIIARQAEVGTLVAPGQAAFTIADTSTVKAVFGATQALVEKLDIGDAVQVFVGAEAEIRTPEKVLDAKVTRIAPAADTSGRVFLVEAALPNERGALRPGAVVSVRVPQSMSGAELPAIPLSAVMRSPDDPRGFSVYVLDGSAERGPVRLAAVELGELVGNSVTVRRGLALGERVVTIGGTFLRDGAEAVVIR